MRFGPNAPSVAAFLEELVGLDSKRALTVSNGRMLAESRGYGIARDRVRSIAQDARPSEWQSARAAAAARARHQLDSSALSGRVVEAIADMAGAIAVRDLISPEHFDTLLVPWTRRPGEPGIHAGRRRLDRRSTGPRTVPDGNPVTPNNFLALTNGILWLTKS